MKFTSSRRTAISVLAFVNVFFNGYTELACCQTTDVQQQTGPLANEKSPRRVELKSYPLATPIEFPSELAHAAVTSIEIAVEIAEGGKGSGQLILKFDTLSFNEFGDAEVVESEPSRALDIELSRESRDKFGGSFYTVSSPQIKKSARVFVHVQEELAQSCLWIGSPPPRLASNQNELKPIEQIPLHAGFEPVDNRIIRLPLRDNIWLHSNYFPTGDHRTGKLGNISLRGKLGGAGELCHDKNHMSLSWSAEGMGGSSTLMAFPHQRIGTNLNSTPDPLGQNRRVYHIVFEKASELGDVSLVAYPAAAGPHRLIIRKAGRIKHVLRMSPYGAERWLALQNDFAKLPATEQIAIARISNATPNTFFHTYSVRDGHVKGISLIGDNISPDTLAELPKLDHLESLFITSSSEIEPSVLASALAGVKDLKKLNLTDLPCSNDVLKAIGQMPRLESLSVYNDKHLPVTDEGLQLISEASTVKNLHVSALAATDAGLLHLTKMRNLKSLQAYVPNATKEGIRRIQENLPPNCKVEINPM